MNKIEFEYDDLVLSDEELVKTVENAMEQIDTNDIIDMIMRATSESEKEEPGKLKSAAPIVRITYIASQIYKNGFMVAAYLINESIKQCFEERV